VVMLSQPVLAGFLEGRLSAVSVASLLGSWLVRICGVLCSLCPCVGSGLALGAVRQKLGQQPAPAADHPSARPECGWQRPHLQPNPCGEKGPTQKQAWPPAHALLAGCGFRLIPVSFGLSALRLGSGQAKRCRLKRRGRPGPGQLPPGLNRIISAARARSTWRRSTHPTLSPSGRRLTRALAGNRWSQTLKRSAWESADRTAMQPRRTGSCAFRDRPTSTGFRSATCRTSRRPHATWPNKTSKSHGQAQA